MLYAAVREGGEMRATATSSAAASARAAPAGRPPETPDNTDRRAMWTQRIVYALAAAAGAVRALPAAAGSPPAPDALTEFAAASWGAGAEGAGMSASVSDDASRVREGAASIRFETNGAF